MNRNYAPGFTTSSKKKDKKRQSTGGIIGPDIIGSRTYEDFVVMKMKNSKRNRGFGFVSFKSEDVLEKVLKEVPHVINEREIDVKRAEPKDENEGQFLQCHPITLTSTLAVKRAQPDENYNKMINRAILVGDTEEGYKRSRVVVDVCDFLETYGTIAYHSCDGSKLHIG